MQMKKFSHEFSRRETRKNSSAQLISCENAGAHAKAIKAKTMPEN